MPEGMVLAFCGITGIIAFAVRVHVCERGTYRNAMPVSEGREYGYGVSKLSCLGYSIVWQNIGIHLIQL
ncbi:hypothetical protein ACTXT7_014465 [Hymenolepis weldensis]